MKKKVLALFMAVGLASTSLPMTVLATETSTVSQQEELGIAEDSETCLLYTSIHILRDFIHGEWSLFYFALYNGKSFG